MPPIAKWFLFNTPLLANPNERNKFQSQIQTQIQITANLVPYEKLFYIYLYLLELLKIVGLSVLGNDFIKTITVVIMITFKKFRLKK